MVIDMISKILFLIFLVTAAWQDYQTKEVDGWIFAAAGIVGMVVCSVSCFAGRRTCLDVGLSFGVGIGLLVFRQLANGGIGDGDGWFFLVSGLYLSGLENLGLFLSGLCICFLWSLPLAVMAIWTNGKGRKRELPFLPFLLPAGIWFAIS